MSPGSHLAGNQPLNDIVSLVFRQKIIDPLFDGGRGVNVLSSIPKIKFNNAVGIDLLLHDFLPFVNFT